MRILLGLFLLLLAGCEGRSNLPPVNSMPSDLQPFVAGLLDEKNDEIRWQAARELGLRGVNSAPAVPHLTAALRDEKDRVRLFAVLALGEIGPSAKSSIPELERVLEQAPDKELQAAAKRSLDRIRGF